MENQETQVQEQVTETSTQEQTAAPQEQTASPYKVFANEDEYKKEIQSTSSKAKYEMLKELNVKNVEEIRVKFSELEAAKAELSEYGKLKDELDNLTAEKTRIAEDLVLTKFGVQDTFKQEALTLAKSKVNDFEGSLEKAMEDVLVKFPSLAGKEQASQQTPSKIGTQRNPASVNVSDQEKERLMKRYPHLKGRI
jgi:hypothetical protein